MDAVESVRFSGGLTANGRIEGHNGWRGPGSVTVRRDGVEFCMGAGFRMAGNRYVQKSDISCVYPARARKLSVTGIVASLIPKLSGTAVRFVTQPIGTSADRDDYIFYSYRHEEWKLIGLLEKLGYPVDREPRTLRFYWEDEVSS
jgi:hypothetical protein